MLFRSQRFYANNGGLVSEDSVQINVGSGLNSTVKIFDERTVKLQSQKEVYTTRVSIHLAHGTRRKAR